MELDLNFSERLEIKEKVNIPEEYFKNTKVKKLDNINIEGYFYYSESSSIHGIFDINGEMIIEDDISLEEINYPFSIKYDDILEENLINDQNTLDLFEFLWENIVLEVPLKFTKVSNLSEFHGDGWKLVSEEEHILENNPFSDLLKDFDKKE